MTYGFKFYNNSNQIVIDDTNVKPWFVGQATVSSTTQYTGDSDAQLVLFASDFAGYAYSGLGVSAPTSWTVYKIRYSVPSSYTVFPAITLPNTLNNIWYSLDTPYSIANTGGYIDIIAYVPNTASVTSADYPEMYCFSVDPIPTQSSAGYGVRVFGDNIYTTGCVFDSTRQHLEVHSYPQVFIPNTINLAGPVINQPSATSVSLPSNPAFVFPKVKLANIVQVIETNSYYGRFYSAVFSRVNSTIYSVAPPFTKSDVVIAGNWDLGSNYVLNNGAGGNQPILVIDTTKLYTGYIPPNLPAAYNLSANKTSITESAGTDTITFTLTTTGVANGTQVPFTISGTGITASDLSTGTLSGSFTVQNGSATYSLYAVSDGIQENDETATLSLTGLNKSISFTIKDGTTYSLTVENGVTSIEEGQGFAVRLTTSGVADGTSVPFTISGVGLDRLAEASLTGNFVISNNVAFKAIKTVQNYGFGDSATIRVSLTNKQTVFVDVQLVDISTNYYESVTIAPDTISTTQGTTITISGGPQNDNVRFQITPASYLESDVFDYYTNDFKTTYSPGTVILNRYDSDTATWYYVSSGVTGNSFGGVGTWKVWTRSNTTKHIRVSNTVTVTAPAPTYSITSDFGTAPIYVSEGQTITFTITTTNVPNGTSVIPTILNATVDANDFVNDPGAAVTIYNNTATFTHQIKADGVAEGQESYYLVIDNNVTPPRTRLATFGTVYINANATYSVTQSVYSVNEGGSITYTCTVNNASIGSYMYWIIGGTNITNNDIYYAEIDYRDGNGFQYLGQVTSGSFYIGSSQVIVDIRLTIRQDQQTEGTEYLGFYLKTGSTSGTVVAYADVTIYDTSTTPSYNPQVTISNPTYGGNMISQTERGTISVTGAPPNSSAYYAVTSTSSGQPAITAGPVSIDGSGNYLNIYATGNDYGGVGNWRLWFQFSDGSVRYADVQVVYDYGVASGGQYCSGYNLMQNYWNGRGGTYSQTVETNSATCGYTPPPTQYYPSIQTYWYDNTACPSGDGYFYVYGCRPGGLVRFTIIEGPSAVGASATVNANGSGTASFAYAANLRPYVSDGWYILTVTFDNQDAYYPSGYRTLTFYYYKYYDNGSCGYQV